MSPEIELVAPAGSMDKLKIALRYGANAVYLGGRSFNLRARSSNFSLAQLEEAAAYVESMEKAREAYFKKFFGVVPDDPALYHMVVNEGGMSTKTVAEIVAHAAKDLEAAMSERVG